MAIYSIKDLEKLSGVKAHTIRVWEQRYGLLTPQRTETNIRYYEDEDLKRLLNVVVLNRNGLKISKIAKFPKEKLAQEVAKVSDVGFQNGAQLDALTMSMLEMDESKFNRIIDANSRQIGFEQTMLEVVYPFLDKLGVLWLTGGIMPVHENFISYLIRQKLISAIDQAPLTNDKDATRVILYLPKEERQELSMLFMQYLLKVRHVHVTYLGQDVEIHDLQDTLQIIKTDYVFTMISETFVKEPVAVYVDKLVDLLPDVQILLSGYQVIAQGVHQTERVKVFNSLKNVLDFVDEMM